MKTLLNALLTTSLLAAGAAGQTTELMSVTDTGVVAQGQAYAPRISADGRFVVFQALGDNLPGGAGFNIFLKDLATESLELASVASNGFPVQGKSPDISADGRYVVFDSTSADVLPGVTGSHVYRLDRHTDTLQLVSADAFGVPGDHQSTKPRISADGRWVAFRSRADNFVGPTTHEQIYLKDMQNGKLRLCSKLEAGAVDLPSTGTLEALDISADGRFVVFDTNANLSPADSNLVRDVYRYDRLADAVQPVSVNASGEFPNASAQYPHISDDGRYVGFTSEASNLSPFDADSTRDGFLKDMQTGACVVVTPDPIGGATQGHWLGDIAHDGLTVYFTSFDALAPEDVSVGDADLYSVPVTGGTPTLLSLDHLGNDTAGNCWGPAVSADGQVIAFEEQYGDVPLDSFPGSGDAMVYARNLSPASVQSFGPGHPGTFGVPGFELTHDPVVGSTPALVIANAAGQSTFAYLFAGFAPGNLQVKGGTLWLQPALQPKLLPLGALGAVISLPVPNEPQWLGVTLYLQAAQADAGASHGVSWTQALELVVGH